MKRYKLYLCLLLVFALSLISLAGCSGNDSESTSSAEQTDTESTAFSYSDGIDENGFWEGITALDCVELFDYQVISVPSDKHTITDDAVQSEIDTVLASYATQNQITDREVADGDTVNIDYVGSVDGVEFDGGNTDGAGTEVTIGVTEYIDGFLEQLIGHTPGETFNVEVTFPDDYGVDDLNGKDAVFVTTINHIVETVNPELTDDFISENLSADYGWTTVDEMKDGLYADLQKDAILSYIEEYLVSNATVKTSPEQIQEYLENSMVNYYEESAASYSMELEEYLSAYAGVSTVDELIEYNHDTNVETANFYLIIQAVAEDAKISVDDEDVANYFKEYVGADDYSQYEEQYGMPYLKQNTLCQLVLDYLADRTVLE